MWRLLLQYKHLPLKLTNLCAYITPLVAFLQFAEENSAVFRDTTALRNMNVNFMFFLCILK
jgi:hypothetical protein